MPNIILKTKRELIPLPKMHSLTEKDCPIDETALIKIDGYKKLYCFDCDNFFQKELSPEELNQIKKDYIQKSKTYLKNNPQLKEYERELIQKFIELYKK